MNLSRQRRAFFWSVWLLCAGVAAGQPLPSPQVTRSYSGQFVVSSAREFSKLLHDPTIAANTNLVRLEPALLTVAAERFKASLWRVLGIPLNAPWRGKIFLSLRPARSADDEVYLSSAAFDQTWNYRLELPDVMPRQRYARAFATVLLLELANRNNNAGPDQAAEIPPWLAAGLAQQALADDAAKIILSAPVTTVDGLAQARSTNAVHGFDALAGTRRILQNFPALTYEQLSWPEDDQLNGSDGGVYLASAQLFVHELIGLTNGAAKCRDLLTRLPTCRNWQMAFLGAFRENFARPLDLEKWWSIRVLAFAAHANGPRWTTAMSRIRLAELLGVPVAFRSDASALPVPAEVPLQTALKNFAPAQRDAVLRTKLRDLELAEFRLAPPFNVLAEGYRSLLADFLGEKKTAGHNASAGSPRATATGGVNLEKIIGRLDELDANRRAVEAKFDAVAQNLNSAPP